jgi:cytochrome oxidase Cu insertion factor (SCO1/SenC/PrrC family)/thiol-disulfide isomerase/thioredoxin
MTRRLWPVVTALVLGSVVAVSVIADLRRPRAAAGPAFTLALDPGTRLSGPAPSFTLTSQTGTSVSLQSLRGKVVILAFTDSECTTVCPLTTTAMVDAQRLLGPAGRDVALLGVDANPQAISIRDVRAYSELHGMMTSWEFLTGSRRQLEHVWRTYHVGVAVQRGQIDHTPALFVISPGGRLEKVYLTQMSYASVGQQGQLLAQEAAGLLPGHPRVQARLSYAQIPTVGPQVHVTLPRAGGGAVRLGPDGAPRLLAFFATWDSEITPLGRELGRLDRYASTAASHDLPQLIGVDEGSVEPSAAALPNFLRQVSPPLSYPVAVDRSGRVADGYGVRDEPWLMLVSGSGQVLWYYDVSTNGWLSTTALVRAVRAALTRPDLSSEPAAVQAALAGSPPLLRAVHQQAGQLLGTETALTARLRALRGFPIVVNVWASWCAPCRSEFGLLAAASARYGRRVAFLGADTGDSPGDARAFLTQHPVSYPSYQAGSPAALQSLAAIEGLPTTIFINSTGKVVYVHTGQYDSQGTLDQDISRYGVNSI